ncbi:MAG: preprotein translocase subunit YajC [Actinobacteria bacterium]|nr:MAG: preprotein translocase subunit YajC [Actinomycetota bacterium]
MHALLARVHPPPRQPAGTARPPAAEPAQSTIPPRFDGRREGSDRAGRVRRLQTRGAGAARCPRRRGGITNYLIVIVAVFALLWFFVLRPQRRRSMEQLQMQDTLSLGDEVITAGGIRGYVRQLDEEVLKVEIAPEVVVRLDRRAVAAVVQEEDDEPQPPTQNESGEG